MLWGSGFCWFVAFSLVFGVLFCSFWHWCTLVFSEIPSYVVWSQKSIWGNSHSHCWNSTLVLLIFWLPLTCMLHFCGSIVLGFLVYNLLLTSSLCSSALGVCVFISSGSELLSWTLRSQISPARTVFIIVALMFVFHYLSVIACLFFPLKPVAYKVMIPSF